MMRLPPFYTYIPRPILQSVHIIDVTKEYLVHARTHTHMCPLIYGFMIILSLSKLQGHQIEQKIIFNIAATTSPPPPLFDKGFYYFSYFSCQYFLAVSVS